MFPEKRYYVSSMPMTEAAIDTGFCATSMSRSANRSTRPGPRAWAVRVYHKPFVDWIWGGCVLMALGGLLAMSDRRYRIKRAVPAARRLRWQTLNRS
jgi:cytochrome c-type biogenesis protein CcmF